MKNPIYDGNILKWNAYSLQQRLEWIRKDICTGPCGQSNSVLEKRCRIDDTIREALSYISQLQFDKFIKNNNDT